MFYKCPDYSISMLSLHPQSITPILNFAGLSLTTYPGLRDGVRCDDTVYCNITSYFDGVLFAKVSSFSNYTTVESGPITYNLTYDENGNLLSGDGFNRTYNGLNQLSSIYDTSTGDLLEDFVYHPTEERVLVKRTYELGSLSEEVFYVDENFVTVSNSSGDYDYTYVIHEGQLVGQEVNGEKTFVHPDHLGSSSVVTDILGIVVEETFFQPYGSILSGGAVSRFDYEGKETSDVTGLTDFHFRQYKSDWGLFTQPDSLLPNVYDPQQLNRYAFERGNPYKYTDPDGHALPAFILLGIAITYFLILEGGAILDLGGIFLSSAMDYYVKSKKEKEDQDNLQSETDSPIFSNPYEDIVAETINQQPLFQNHYQKISDNGFNVNNQQQTQKVQEAHREGTFSYHRAERKGEIGGPAYYDKEGRFHQSTGGYYLRNPVDVRKQEKSKSK
jgi:RHS repeat-associated protein